MATLPHIVAGIDLGSKTTRVVVCEVNPLNQELKIIGSGSAPSFGLHHGYITNRHEAIKSVQAALRDAQREAGVNLRTVYCAMGGISLDAESVTTTISVEHAMTTGEVTEDDVYRVIQACEHVLLGRTNNRRILHTVPLRFHLDGETVLGHPVGMRGKKLSAKVIFVTCLEHHFDELVSVMNEAGVQVVDVVASPLACSYPALTKSHKMAGTALVDIGAETVSVAVFEDDRLVSLDIFPIGSTDITNDIALGFQIPLDDAEQVKLGALPKEDPKKFSRSKLEEIIRARVTDIFDLVDRHLKEIKRGSLLPAGIVITGGGSMLDNFNIQDFAKTFLRLPIRIASQTPLITPKKKLDSSWYVAYGLCVLAAQGEEPRYQGPHPLRQATKHLKEKLGKFFKQMIP